MNEKEFRAINLWMADVGRVQPLVGLYPTDPVNCSRYVKCQRRNRAVSWNVGVGFVVWWSVFLRKQHKRLELCCPPSNISCFHMAEFCIRVAYVSVGVRFAIIFLQIFVFYGLFCVFWAYGATGGCFGLVYAWMLNGFFTFYMPFWSVCQQVCSLCLVFRIDFDDRFIFLKLLTCECRSKAEFSWITQC